MLSQGQGATHDSDRLVLKTEEEHPYARIAMEEWGAANCRLMNFLMQEGKLARKDVEFYLAYTTKIFDLAELYEWHSVLDFDHQYRELQAAHAFPWGTFAPHLEQKLIPRRSNSNNNKIFNAATKTGSPQPNQGQQECKLFKASRGTYCPFGEGCRYKHTVRPFPAPTGAGTASTPQPAGRGTPPPATRFRNTAQSPQQSNTPP